MDIGTNPACRCELHKIRRGLAQERLFTVVQDAFLTETARLWLTSSCRPPSGARRPARSPILTAPCIFRTGESTPPGEAKSDMEIFLDFCGSMDFRDKDGQPLIKWTTPEEVFEAWKECSADAVPLTAG